MTTSKQQRRADTLLRPNLAEDIGSLRRIGTDGGIRAIEVPSTRDLQATFKEQNAIIADFTKFLAERPARK